MSIHGIDDKTEAFIKRQNSDSSDSDSAYGQQEKKSPDGFTAVRKQNSMKGTFNEGVANFQM